LTCKFFGKRIYGGISRLKYHLAKITGFDVDIYLNSSLEIMRIANQSLIDMANKRDAIEACKKELELANRNTGTSASEGDQYHKPTPQRQGPQLLQSAHQPHLSLCRGQHLGGQPSIHSLIKRKETEEADKLVAKCFLWSDIPFNIPNNPFYHSMFEAAAIVGPGYRGPSYRI
jgi:hypothetical protein